VKAFSAEVSWLLAWCALVRDPGLLLLPFRQSLYVTPAWSSVVKQMFVSPAMLCDSLPLIPVVNKPRRPRREKDSAGMTVWSGQRNHLFTFPLKVPK
jgi:hypothetical protein